MKHYIITILSLLGFTTVYSQGINVKGFEQDPTDLTARRIRQTDANGNTLDLALVKVAFVESDVEFAGNVVKQIAKKGEYWVYLPDGATHLTIKTKSAKGFDYQFPEPLQKLCTYRLVIENPNRAISMEEAKEAVKGAESMSFKTFKDHKTLKCGISIDMILQYPDGDSFVDNTMRECLNEELGGTYTGDLKDGNALVQHYASEWIQTNAPDGNEFYDYLENQRDSLFVVSQTSKLLSMCRKQVTWSDMAAPKTLESYYTLRKADGARFDQSKLRDTDTPAFHRLILDGLKQDFSKKLGIKIATDELLGKYVMEYLDLELDEVTIQDISGMYVTESEVVFVFYKGEAQWEVERIESRIPIEKMRQYVASSMYNSLR